MAGFLRVTIDLTRAGLTEDCEDLEAQSLTLVDELQTGNIVNSARLARQADLPEGAKAEYFATIVGVLTAEISRKQLKKKAINFLGNYFYGKPLRIEHKKTLASGESYEVAFDYRNQAEMEQALSAIERLDARAEIKIRVLDTLEAGREIGELTASPTE